MLIKARWRFVALLVLVPATTLVAGYCRISVAGLNRYRFVPGWAPLGQECGWEEPGCWHSPPFGNWGVDSNYGSRVDGAQFVGWHGGQWNSCTYFYPPPDCRYYNFAWPHCTDQQTASGVNVHGTKHVDIAVRCPEDWDGDGICDRGGCKDVGPYGEWYNFAELYEIDLPVPPWCGRDDYVDTLYFPPTEVNLVCEPGYCYGAGTDWAARTSSSFTYAEMAMVVNEAWYVDDIECERLREKSRWYDCWW
jgi:hypothetical protein